MNKTEFAEILENYIKARVEMEEAAYEGTYHFIGDVVNLRHGLIHNNVHNFDTTPWSITGDDGFDFKRDFIIEGDRYEGVYVNYEDGESIEIKSCPILTWGTHVETSEFDLGEISMCASTAHILQVKRYDEYTVVWAGELDEDDDEYDTLVWKTLNLYVFDNDMEQDDPVEEEYQDMYLGDGVYAKGKYIYGT